MKVNVNELLEKSNYENSDLWIAEVNFYSERERIIKPTKAKLLNSSEAKKTIYYSKYFFRPYSKTGTLLKQDISIFDNTGFRSNKGNPISVFDNEEECIKWFNEKIKIKIEERLTNRASVIERYDSETKKYEEMICN